MQLQRPCQLSFHHQKLSINDTRLQQEEGHGSSLWT